MGNTNDRLQAIEGELKNILESRVNELMSSMRQAETLTRRIVAAETEISQSRQLRENLETEIERVRGDVNAMRARVDEIRQANGELWTQRDKLREELRAAEAEVAAAEKEVTETRSSVAVLNKQHDTLKAETSNMQVKVKALEETVNRMRELREQLRSSIGSLSNELGSSGS